MVYSFLIEQALGQSGQNANVIQNVIVLDLLLIRYVTWNIIHQSPISTELSIIHT